MHRTLKAGLPLLLWILSGLSGPGTVESADLPRVRLIATGGTIANRAGNRLTATDLIRSVPTLDHYVQAEAEQFANVPSNSLTLAQWMGLSRRINELFEQQTDLAGIVVTSGTDTLEETAYFLHLTVRSDRPVVVVGSMRSPGTLGYDGAANLLEAFRVAAEPASRGRGVLVVLDGEINSAREVTKDKRPAPANVRDARLRRAGGCQQRPCCLLPQARPAPHFHHRARCVRHGDAAAGRYPDGLPGCAR